MSTLTSQFVAPYLKRENVAFSLSLALSSLLTSTDGRIRTLLGHFNFSITPLKDH